MASDIDEQDLYPADVENPTPEARRQRNRAAIGTALVVWGTALLVERATGVDVETGMLGLGLGALVGWSRVRRYWWFVAGAILTGIGVGDFVTHIFDGPLSSAVSALCTAGGFGAVYARYPLRSSWARIPAAIMVFVAVLALGVGLIGLIPKILGNLLLPVLLISGGTLLLFRHSIPRKAVRVGLAAVAAAFVLVGASNVSRIGDISWPRFSEEVEVDLPSLEGKRLVLLGGSGDVDIHETKGPARVVATVSSRGRSVNPLEAVAGPDDVTVAPRSGAKPLGSADYEAWVPAGTDVRVVVGSGDIEAQLSGGDIEFEAGRGDISLHLLDGNSETDGTFDLLTGSGDVDVNSEDVIQLNILTEGGDIEVDHDDIDSRVYSDGETGPELNIRTGSGDVDIESAA